MNFSIIRSCLVDFQSGRSFATTYYSGNSIKKNRNLSNSVNQAQIVWKIQKTLSRRLLPKLSCNKFVNIINIKRTFITGQMKQRKLFAVKSPKVS